MSHRCDSCESECNAEEFDEADEPALDDELDW